MGIIIESRKRKSNLFSKEKLEERIKRMNYINDLIEKEISKAKKFEEDHKKLSIDDIKQKIYQDGSLIRFLSKKEQAENRNLCFMAMDLNPKNIKYIKDMTFRTELEDEYNIMGD
jgi:hypothetical protein